MMNNRIIKRMLIGLLALFPLISSAETHRDSVSKEEVNGTFTMKYSEPFADMANTLTVKALGGGKISIDFDLVRPYIVKGETQANMGTLTAEADIKGDTAVYHSSEMGECTITITFVKPGMVTVKQEGADFDCGFGHNVYADGTYYKNK